MGPAVGHIRAGPHEQAADALCTAFPAASRHMMECVEGVHSGTHQVVWMRLVYCNAGSGEKRGRADNRLNRVRY